jgi:hypothetical protein
MKALKKFYSWNHYIYFIFFIAISVFTVSAYVDIKNKEDFIQYNNPVKVYILNIYRFAKSSSTCDVTYNNSVYKGIPYPGKLKEGEYNDDIFYYDKEKDILFVGKVEYKIVYILSSLSFFFLLLWIKNIRKS